MIGLNVARETWPIRGTFTISRGSKSAAEVVVATLEQDGAIGRGECVPYARYGETIDSVIEQINSLEGPLKHGLDRSELQSVLPAGAARNAVDCAFWDLEAKLSLTPVWQLAGLPAPVDVITAYTLSLGSPDQMAEQAAAVSDRALLKLKLGGDGDLDRVAAVRTAAPAAHLIADANEAWSIRHMEEFGSELSRLNVELIEQPLPAGQDDTLKDIQFPIPLCADESCHDTKSLDNLLGKYDVVNVKLDKTGGLTEAINLLHYSTSRGISIMLGCMVATSLAMAPALLLASAAKFVDLDGPLLLDKDRKNGLTYTDSTVSPPVSNFWG